MKKIATIILAVFSVLLLMGCTSQVTVVTDEGEKVTVTAGEGADGWCQTGANWEMAAAGADDSTEVSWVIEALETSGDYNGLCHVVYTAKDQNGEVMNINYWFDESGKNGFFEMDVGGQKFTQEYHG
ncbi:hypothetical protein GOV03_01585 [Candidatus Woesearchaeota archaeon]|nr:hypothetical protein [Candidatus Woesearchaeota archaeon]